MYFELRNLRVTLNSCTVCLQSQKDAWISKNWWKTHLRRVSDHQKRKKRKKIKTWWMLLWTFVHFTKEVRQHLLFHYQHTRSGYSC